MPPPDPRALAQATVDHLVTTLLGGTGLEHDGRVAALRADACAELTGAFTRSTPTTQLPAMMPALAHLFAWAIHWRWLGGLVAGVALALSDLAVRGHVTQANYGNVFLLLIGGPIVGFMCASLARMADERDRAERAAAAAAERARLARAVHDGVLQVLALVWVATLTLAVYA